MWAKVDVVKLTKNRSTAQGDCYNPMQATEQCQNLQGSIYDPMHILHLDEAHESILCSNLIRDNQKFQQGIFSAQAKSALEGAILEKKEKIRLNRELISYDIYENSAGQLRKEIIDANGDVVGSTLLTDSKNIKLTKYVCKYGYGVETALCFCWKNGNEEYQIFLHEDASVDEIRRVLTKAGLVLKGAREYSMLCWELVLAHLEKNKITKEIPRTIGWNKLSDGWVWISDGGLVMEEVERNAKK